MALQSYTIKTVLIFLESSKRMAPTKELQLGVLKMERSIFTEKFLYHMNSNKRRHWIWNPKRFETRYTQTPTYVPDMRKYKK